MYSKLPACCWLRERANYGDISKLAAYCTLSEQCGLVITCNGLPTRPFVKTSGLDRLNSSGTAPLCVIGFAETTPEYAQWGQDRTVKSGPVMHA
jgi:hypothetical protein